MRLSVYSLFCVFCYLVICQTSTLTSLIQFQSSESALRIYSSAQYSGIVIGDCWHGTFGLDVRPVISLYRDAC